MLIAKEKDIEAWYSYKYIFEKERVIRTYYKEKEIFSRAMEGVLNNRINLEITQMYPIDNYDMKFYGNNRVISFRLNNSDVKYYNKSPLVFDYIRGEGKGKIRIDLYLYLPEDKELKAENFVLIR